MQPIDIGDFALPPHCSTLQQALFEAVRNKIINRLWSNGGKLPSTRKFADALGISRNSVIAAYEQLAAEGYIESRRGSGYFVAVAIPESYLQTGKLQVGRQQTFREKSVSNSSADHASIPFDSLNQPFAPGIPDLKAFPYSKWQRVVQRHLSRPVLSGHSDLQGLPLLREALSHYLSSSRSVDCEPSRIIITSGAQQALSIAIMATLAAGQKVLVENPGYTQMRKALALSRVELSPVTVSPRQGLMLDDVLQQQAAALYITPSNQYPLGTSLNTEQRLALIEWANQHNTWIIEDDYDSEFQFAHRPYTSLQGLASQSGSASRCIYIGSFSKTMFNALRIGYMVVPELLVERCLEIKDAISGDTPNHLQAALADFIIEGDLLRHIRKMRRLYHQKHSALIEAIDKYFGQPWEVVSQAAGLHVTVRWYGGPPEHQFCLAAQQQGVIVRPLSYYEHIPSEEARREWRSVVLGFGNVALNDIEPLLIKLKSCFG